MNQKLKTAIFIFLLLILLVPMIQQSTGLLKEKPFVARRILPSIRDSVSKPGLLMNFR